ncbi:MAG: hypothetical protein ABIK37_02475 [candidate division WOR-3 bacterium]
MALRERKARSHSSRKSSLNNVWVWVVGGVVVAAMLFMVARTMSSAPAPPAPPQRVDPAKTDVSAYTQMVGEPCLDTTFRHSISGLNATAFVQIESMVRNRELRDAIARMQRMLVRTQRSSPERALLHGYVAACEYELANPNAVLVNLLKGFALADTTDSSVAELKAWLGFQAGWLFQYHGLTDSAREYYSQALQTAPTASRLRPWLLNNLGVTMEATGDTVGAAEAYRSAAAAIDTTQANRTTNRILNNLRRLSARIPVARP